MSTDIELIQSDIYDDRTRADFMARLSDPSLNFEAEAGFAMQIISAGGSYIQDAAMSNRTAVINAVVNVAAIGLSLNPARKHAYLVPRRPKKGQPVQVCLDISYIGLVELAVISGAILLAQARIVRENDEFFDNGPGERPTHRYRPFDKNRGEIAGVYVAAKLPSGDWHTEFMTVEDINKIRDRSDSYASGKGSPWNTDWEEMAKKTVAKRASKWWRGNARNSRLDNAIHHLNTEAGEGLADAPRDTGGDKFDPDYWIKKALATTSEKALTAIHAAAMEAAAQVGDRHGARKFKEEALKHRAKLRSETVTDV